MDKKIITRSATETEQLAERIGAMLRGSEVIELISDVGGGKTTFVHGLARGIGSSDRVASPTFTISRLYASSTVKIHHLDLYRVEDATIMRHQIDEILDDDTAILVVEWASVVKGVLPEERVTIELQVTGEDTREVYINAPKKQAYILGEL